MEHPEGEGGSVQPNREERKEIVPGFNEEELFEFSLDQIMNGNLDERREVVEYLVDEFDEMSLAMVEGLRRFAYRDAIQDREHDDEDDDETGSGSDSEEDNQTNRNEPEAPLKLVSDYQKRRLDGMTDQEKDKFIKQRREHHRNRYHSLGLEGKAKRIREITEWRRKKRLESEEYREKVREYNRKYSAKLTEEQKIKNRESQRQKWQNMSEDQRKLARLKKSEAQKLRRAKKRSQK